MTPTLLLALVLAGGAAAQGGPAADADDAAVPGFPPLGRWMLDATGAPAHWLGEKVDGKRLREPINLVVIDPLAATAEDARTRLVAAAAAAGYPVRVGHSSGYRARIGGAPFPQLPSGWDDAFSNRMFEFTNNHGRLFGPYRHEGGYLFVGAFSRERVAVFAWPEHRYGSFVEARDHFAASLVARAGFERTGTVDLGNAIRDDPAVTTGDHDGRAVVLRATR